MKINLILFFVLMFGFLQFIDCQICDSKNKIGTCATLQCPSLNCKKPRCTQRKEQTNETAVNNTRLETKGTPPNAGIIAGFVCGSIVVLVTVVIVTVKCIRSRRRPNRTKSMSENPPMRNPYSQQANPVPPRTMPHFLPYPEEEEPIYIDPDYQSKDNLGMITTTGEDSAGYYLIPEKLIKPNLPLPPFPNSP